MQSEQWVDTQVDGHGGEAVFSKPMTPDELADSREVLERSWHSAAPADDECAPSSARHQRVQVVLPQQIDLVHVCSILLCVSPS